MSTYSATTNGTAAKAPASGAAPDLRRDGSKDALAQLGRRLAQEAPSQVSAGSIHMQAGMSGMSVYRQACHHLTLRR